MYPVLFSIGNITIYSFGLFLSLAILLCGVGLFILAKIAKLNVANFFDKYLLIIFVGLVCARITYAILYPDAFKAPTGNFWSIFALWQGGLVFYGALIGGFITFVLLYKYNKNTLPKWLDLVYLVFMLGMSIGQLGCTLGGCSVGATTDVMLSINNKIPASLYESIFTLALAIAGGIIYFKFSKIPKYKNGIIFVVGIATFLVGRMLIDYFKVAKYSLWGVTAYLWIDIIIVSVIALLLFATVLLKIVRFRTKKVSL
jgi:phosphatidylglycerol:prolipoprotein diacylglycerol transferase